MSISLHHGQQGASVTHLLVLQDHQRAGPQLLGLTGSQLVLEIRPPTATRNPAVDTAPADPTLSPVSTGMGDSVSVRLPGPALYFGM